MPSSPHTLAQKTPQSLAPLFVSHGSPMLVARQSTAAFDFFTNGLNAHLEGAKAILMISAHWQTDEPTVSTADQQETIHDFYGFPAPLYQLQYCAKGDPDLAREIARRIGAQTDDQRGLDHGAWMPLILARPQADIPVFQLSMLAHGGPKEHFELGKKLRGLRELGVLVIGSGAMTHNLRTLDRNDGPQVDGWAREFCDWMIDRTLSHSEADLMAYRDEAPFATRAHPEDDHLMPFYVALGAADENYDARVLNDSYEFGNLAMTALRFYDQGDLATAA